MAGVKTSSITSYIHLAFYITVEVFDGKMMNACDKAKTTIRVVKLNHLIHIVVTVLIYLLIYL